MGIEVTHLTERIHNRRTESFLSKFYNYRESRFKLKDPISIRSTISNRFKNKLDESFLDYLVECIINRINGTKFEIDYKLGLIEFAYFMQDLDIQYHLLLSKLLSKLGQFVLAYEIEKKASEIILSKDFYSIFSLLQIVKIKLYDEKSDLEFYLYSLKLTTHFNKFFHLNRFLEKLDLRKTNSNDLIYVLGPLRNNKDLTLFINNKIGIIKPSSSELDLITVNSFKSCFLYSDYPIDYKFDIEYPIINIVDHKLKHKDDLIHKMNYYSQFFLINGYPAHLQRLLIHQLIETENNFFGINFVSFYLSDVLYSDSYRWSSKKNSEKTNHEIHHYIWGNGWHGLVSNFKFCKFLYRIGLLINNQDSVKQLLQLSIEDYALELEKNYKFK
jgi:hypothetical protein